MRSIRKNRRTGITSCPPVLLFGFWRVAPEDEDPGGGKEKDPAADHGETRGARRIEQEGENKRADRHEQHCHGKDDAEHAPEIRLVRAKLDIRHELNVENRQRRAGEKERNKADDRAPCERSERLESERGAHRAEKKHHEPRFPLPGFQGAS